MVVIGKLWLMVMLNGDYWKFVVNGKWWLIAMLIGGSHVIGNSWLMEMVKVEGRVIMIAIPVQCVQVFILTLTTYKQTKIARMTRFSWF